MVILVTGGAGFIGFHVAKSLLGNGNQVIVVDNFNNYYDPAIKEDRIKKLLENYQPKLYRLDISNFQELKKVFVENKIDKICHLGAQAGVRYSLENPKAYLDSNIIGTNNLLELAKEFKIEDFVLASSSSVYGNNKKMPFSETDFVENPISLYAATKKANELQAHVYHHLYGINVFCLRFFTVYGPWGRPDMAYFKFVRSILADQPIEVFNNGKMKRDFTYIDDIVSAVALAINKCKGYEVINLGNNKPVKLDKFIEIIESNLGMEAKIKYLEMQPGDLIDTSADIKKAKEILGWLPKIGIEEGLKNFIDWYKDYFKI